MAPSKLKTFASNRVAEIQELTGQYTWRHVSGSQNPADLLSRGLMPRSIENSKLWWNGPEWLEGEEHFWPSTIYTHQTRFKDLPDTKKTTTSLLVRSIGKFPVENFSKLVKLKRVVAWIIRFKENCLQTSNQRYSKFLSVSEIDDAFKTLIKLSQNEYFDQEIKSIKCCNQLSSRSRILGLDPFLDETEVLRVGGRLRNSQLSIDTKHPVLLHSKHHLTRLIFEEEHVRLLHSGPQQLFASVRERFWIVGGRALAKSVVRRCITCFRHKPRIAQPIMCQLPEQRLAPSSPFSITGIDYAGPLFIKDRKGRGSKTSKCYICIFVCFSTKAIHLELVSDLTKEAFLMSLKRFMARRGKPCQIYSDNGKNFVAAHRELKQLYEFIKHHETEFTDYCANENITWKFMPSYTPHFGGLWEAGVKSCKFHLRRVLGNACLTFEELNTILVQIEAILNSRPLFPLSSDPQDLTPLTPAHFLVGRPLVTIPELDCQQVPMGRLTRYQHLQQCQQHFWSRWHKEYLAELQQRTKWKKRNGELKLGSLVVLRDDNCPPLRWKLGRVTQLHPGKDGVSRVASIRVVNGVIKRAYSKLCPLPEGEE